MITCESCGHPLQVDLAAELTPDWNYRAQCEYCGEEQYGVLYYGAFYAVPQIIAKGESA
jgi:hypothetical protein